MNPLTDKQMLVYNFIRSYQFENGFPPTRKEIAEYFSFKSANAAQETLKWIAKKGFIRLLRGSSRGIVLNDINEKNQCELLRMEVKRLKWLIQNMMTAVEDIEEFYDE